MPLWDKNQKKNNNFIGLKNTLSTIINELILRKNLLTFWFKIN